MPDGAIASPVSVPVLDVRDLKKHFPVRKGVLRTTTGHVYAVDGVSFSIARGQTLGLVGESGCGKSTVARAVIRLIEPTAGEVRIFGRDILSLTKAEMRPYQASGADHLSGSVLVAQSAHVGGRNRWRTAARSQHRATATRDRREWPRCSTA